MIRVSEVRLIGADGQQVGVIPTREAFQIAETEGLDLVEIAPNASPPVCKVMDYGKFQYEKAKKRKKLKKSKQKSLSRRLSSDLTSATTIMTTGSDMRKNSWANGSKSGLLLLLEAVKWSTLIWDAKY